MINTYKVKVDGRFITTIKGTNIAEIKALVTKIYGENINTMVIKC